MKKILYIICLILSIFAIGCSSGAVQKPEVPVVKQEIIWHEYSEKSFSLAEEQNKPVFLVFTASWCSACRYYNKKFLSNQEIVYIINQYYIPIKVDDKNKIGFNKICDDYGVEVIPTTFFIRSNGVMVNIQGVPPMAQFLAFLKFFM